MLVRFCLLVLLLVGWSSARGGVPVLSKAVSKLTRTVSATLVGGMLLLAASPVGGDPRTDWHDVEPTSQSYQHSVFYLHTDVLGSDYAMHLVYLGANKDEEAVFVGLLPQLLRTDDPQGREIRKAAEFAFYAYDGLVADEVDVEEIASFPIKDSGVIVAVDVVMGTIADLDLNDTIPIRVAPFPTSSSRLQVLNYQPSADGGAVLRWQTCLAGTISRKTNLAGHTCLLPTQDWRKVAYSFGAPLFDYHTQTLVGFTTVQANIQHEQVWPTDSAAILSVEILRGLQIPLSVEVSEGKLSTTWGELKRGKAER